MTKINLRIISKPHAYLQCMDGHNICKVSRESVLNCRRSCAHIKVPTIYSLYQELKREITLKEWAPSPLNLPERKNMGPLNFHIQLNYIPNFKILALTVPDRVLSVTHTLHRLTDRLTALDGQTQTNMPPQLLKLGA